MTQSSPDAVISHWYKLLESLQYSALEFYSAVEKAVADRQIPSTSTSRVDRHEGGVLSARREYLRIERGQYIFDVCGAPFGKGFFVSWWLSERRSPFGVLALLLFVTCGLLGLGLFLEVFGVFHGLLLGFIGLPVLFWLFVRFINQYGEGWDDALVAMPVLGRSYERIFRPPTYYKIDTVLMFQQAVHTAVLEVVDGITSGKGLRKLSELERKPILRKFG